MKYKNLGILALLLAICLITTLLNGRFVSNANIQTLVRWTSLFGLFSIGVAFVIITGGIDLSIGSQIALTGCLLVLFVGIRYEDSGQTAIVREVVQDPVAARLRLDPIPPDLGDGDRLLYFTFGDRQSTVADIQQADGQTWVVLRGPAADLQPDLEVRVRKLLHRPVWLAVLGVLTVALGIGLLHGLLVTKAGLQPFVVTLCGLLVYRGIARVLTGDDQVGLETALTGFKEALTGPVFDVPVPLVNWISEGNWSRYAANPSTGQPLMDASGQPIPLDFWQWISVPMPGLMLLSVAVLAWLFLNRTVWGRHLMALGRNEQAARYSGIRTDRLVILAYVICSLLVGVAGILFTLDLNSVQPGTTGSFYELYAIAAAVLGGCSLRGGEGSILGVVVGTAVMRCLYNAIVVLGIPSTWEYVLIGGALFAGVVADELVRRLQQRRRLRLTQ
jgi:ribose transport system permease protein